MNVNVSNIKDGMTVKNYKIMCELLNESIKSGKAKTMQLEKWKSYFSYSKSGQSFIIHEVYLNPKIKQSLKHGIITHIEELVLDILVQGKNKGKLFLSKNKLFRQLNMVNDNYNFGRYNVPKLSQLININENDIKEFYDLSNGAIKRSVENALDSLRDKSLVFWQPVRTVCIANSKIEINENGDHKIKEIYNGINEYDEDIYEYIPEYRVTHTYREATEEEIEKILEIERDTLDYLNCTGKQDAYNNGKWNKFVQLVKMKLLERLNILFYYDSYKIICNEKHILTLWEELNELSLDEWDRNNKSKKLNLDVQLNLLSNTENRQNKAKESKKPNSEKTKRRLDHKYLDNHKELIHTLINSDSEDIRNKIRSEKVGTKN